MTFSIVLKNRISIEGSKFMAGKIIVGDLDETFHASLGYWSPSQYKRQWVEGLRRIIDGGFDRSRLITSLSPPGAVGPTFSWSLYADTERVTVQQGLFIPGELGTAIDPADPYASIKDFAKVTDDGRTISSWVTTRSEIKAFLSHTNLDSFGDREPSSPQ